MGLVTIEGYIEGQLTFRIPNHVIRMLHCEELAVILRSRGGAAVDTWQLQNAVSKMAYHGDLEPFFGLVQRNVLEVLSNRDLIRFDEKAVKVILLTYLSLSPIYRPISELELSQGYADLFLALDRRYPDAKYAFLLELKSLKAGASPEEVETKRLEAVGQLERYLADPRVLELVKGYRTLRAVSVVVVGGRELLWKIELERA